MLQQLRKTTTAAVSALLLAITITLTLTLTVSVSAEPIETAATAISNTKVEVATATTNITSTPIPISPPPPLQPSPPTPPPLSSASSSALAPAPVRIEVTADAETTAVISKSLQDAISNGTLAETTTTRFLTLQPPPLNVTSPTTSSYALATEAETDIETATATPTGKSTETEQVTATKNSINHESNNKNNSQQEVNNVAVKSDGALHYKDGAKVEQIAAKTITDGKLPINRTSLTALFPYGQAFQPQSSTTENYIGYDFTQRKTETVKEILTNLFPNGFSDIFRFSYSTEPTTTPIDDIPTTTATPTVTTVTPTIIPLTPNSSFSYTSSVSKEYRRLISPGHTEIVVEKLALPNSSEEFRDGSNSISKNELLRINRAAEEAPVLPSLLMEPTSANNTEQPTAPIVILKASSAEQDDDDSDEINDDNQIAESQDVTQHVYQPLPESYVYKTDFETIQQQQKPQINVEVIHDDNVKQNQKRAFGDKLFTPANELQNAELQIPINAVEDQQTPQHPDNYQQSAEKNFQAPHETPEAPSRKFLKQFNPQLTESVSGLVKKGNFHYELRGRQHRLHSTPQYVKPAAQIEFQQKYPQSKQQNSNGHQNVELNAQFTASQAPSTEDYNGYQSTPAPDNVVFVTLNTPKTTLTASPTPLSLLPFPDKTPHQYVAEAVGAASQNAQNIVTNTEEEKPKQGYTFVEIQKSVNIHNKLITEMDGRLIEEHETFYEQPEHNQHLDVNAPVSVQPQQSPVSPKDYVSLSANPINVQHIDDETDPHIEEASQTTYQHVEPVPQNNYVEKVVPQPYPVPVEKIVDRPYPVPHIVEKPVPAPYPVKEIIEKVVDRPVPVPKIVEQPVKVPYPVQVNHYIDRPYPVREIIEQHVAVPYAVPEPVAVPVPIEHYIDRPYPVETIVEKRIPYPVEKVVEKIVEKHVPIEVERIVEKPQIVEKFVEKLVDRPIAIPIHVPVAVPVPIGHGDPHYAQFSSPPFGHPNALQWAQGQLAQYQKLPPKVLQNYYTRMLKKLLNLQLPNAPNQPNSLTSTAPIQSPVTNKPTQPTKPIQFAQPVFKITDIRYDLKPPPPPLGPSWSKGARYIYNTLPVDLTPAASTLTATAPDHIYQQQHLYLGAVPPTGDVVNDDFHHWRNGHSLKRSPDFGRNLHIEYGFKPPLVPSVEIDEKGVPLKAVAEKQKSE